MLTLKRGECSSTRLELLPTECAATVKHNRPSVCQRIPSDGKVSSRWLGGGPPRPPSVHASSPRRPRSAQQQWLPSSAGYSCTCPKQPEPFECTPSQKSTLRAASRSAAVVLRTETPIAPQTALMRQVERHISSHPGWAATDADEPAWPHDLVAGLMGRICPLNVKPEKKKS